LNFSDIFKLICGKNDFSEESKDIRYRSENNFTRPSK